MKFKKITILILGLLMLLPLVSAFSMSPGSYRYEYDEINGLEERFGFQLNSATQKTIIISIEKSGALKDYLEVDTEAIQIEPGESEIVPMTLTLPANLDKVGKQEASVTFTKKVLSDNGGFMAVTTAYRARIIVTFAYPGEYVNIISLKPENTNQGENTFVDWEVQARGTDTSTVLTELIISDSKGNIVFSKNHEPVNLDRNELYSHKTNVPSQTYLPGTYNVTLKANTSNNFEEKSQILKIGEEDIILKNFSPENFTVGNIMEFSITLENSWGEEFKNVYATLDVNETQTTTKSINMPAFAKSTIDNQFINLAYLAEGVYPGKLKVYFDENMKEFDINITALDPIKESNITTTIALASMALILLIIVTLIVLFKKHNKHKK